MVEAFLVVEDIQTEYFGDRIHNMDPVYSKDIHNCLYKAVDR